MAAKKIRAKSASTKHYPNSQHPNELGPDDVPDVYASICRGDCLEPSFQDGACMVFTKLVEPEPGDFVGFWLHPDALAPGELPRRVKRLYMNGLPGMTLPWVPKTGDDVEPIIVFEQLKPPKLLHVRASRVLAMHKVIGKAAPNEDGTATLCEAGDRA